MNRTEAVKLCRLIRALCPTQPLDVYTPDAWSLVMADIRYDDATEAVQTIYRNQGNDQEWGGRRIEADDIIREVRRIRNQRIKDHPPIDPPTGLTVHEYHDWLIATHRAIADGEVIRQAALPARDMTPLQQLTKRPT